MMVDRGLGAIPVRRPGPLVVSDRQHLGLDHAGRHGGRGRRAVPDDGGRYQYGRQRAGRQAGGEEGQM
jgi:hypothetical protein